jgi:hypothetical protein
MVNVFKGLEANVTHFEDPSVQEIRGFFRDTLIGWLIQKKDEPTKLWVYVTGHSFETEEGLAILLNDTVSLFQRPNPYPIQNTLGDICKEFPNFKVEIFNDCCLQPLPKRILNSDKLEKKE